MHTQSLPVETSSLRSDLRAVVRGRRPWRLTGFTVTIIIVATASLVAGLYPATAAWIASYNQTQVIVSANDALRTLQPSPEDQLEAAHAYNEALSSGVLLSAGANKPIGDGQLHDQSLRYDQLLRANSDGLIGRVRIPAIDVDLPFYHGTSEETLRHGAGHLEGTHLPVGGDSTRTVLTAHRGLASSTLFTHLDRVASGDQFTIEVLGEIFTYQVREVRVIAPDETDSLRAEIGRDLATLITCTPLGINTHRIVVTGERVTPTPTLDMDVAGTAPEIPGFPWWALIGAGGLMAIALYTLRRGFTDGAIYAARQGSVHNEEQR